MPFIDNIVQPTHLIIVLAVALLVLGPKRLPEVGRAIGRGIHDMKSVIDDVKPSRHDLLGTAEADAPAAATADRKA
ncbi:MAG TPA: twin-arginine translocase TatA/TatE family subunit [Solirubrobacteraceae bacterium]